MQTRKLEPERWREYFDWLSRHMPVVRAELEVDSLALGSQIESGPLVIDGVSYDPYARELVVTATSAQLEHHIANPQEIYVMENGGQPSAFEILDAEGQKQILRLTPLRELSPPPA